MKRSMHLISFFICHQTRDKFLLILPFVPLTRYLISNEMPNKNAHDIHQIHVYACDVCILLHAMYPATTTLYQEDEWIKKMNGGSECIEATVPEVECNYDAYEELNIRCYLLSGKNPRIKAKMSANKMKFHTIDYESIFLFRSVTAHFLAIIVLLSVFLR